MAWIIEHITEIDDESGAPLTWSNSWGWVGGDDFDTFSDEEHCDCDLPFGGQWVQVAWRVAK